VVGAGAALLLAPVSGETLRRTIAGYFKPTKAEETPEDDLHRLDTEFDSAAAKSNRADARAS
jgi:gas vesicle protein